THVPGVAVSHRAQPRVAAVSNGIVSVWSADSDAEPDKFPTPQQTDAKIIKLIPGGIAFSLDGASLAIATENGIAVRDVTAPTSRSERRYVGTMTHRFDIIAIAFVAGGTLAVARSDGAVAFLKPTQYLAHARTYVFPPGIGSKIDRFAASGDGS